MSSNQISFLDRVKQQAYLIAKPRVQYKEVKTSETDVEDARETLPDGPEIFRCSQSFHVPYFIILISLVEVLSFLYDAIKLRLDHCLTVDYNGPVPLCSPLIYNPYRRYEVWRFITYMLVHAGLVHIISNVVVQILLGIFLEIYHGSLRIATVYFAGVLTGALLTSVTDSHSFLAGASGGSYALLAAHLPTLIMNWKSMKSIFERLVSILILVVGLVDFIVAICHRYTSDGHGSDTSVGYAAHLGGAAAGFLIGMNVLRNLEHEPWEGKLRLICWIIWVCGVIAFVLVNALGGESIFAKSDFSSISSCSYFADEKCSLD